jgi:hypothetical protein
MPERLCCPMDAYLLLERDGKLLMLRCAPGAAYAAGLLCPPSVHLASWLSELLLSDLLRGCVMAGGRHRNVVSGSPNGGWYPPPR